LYKIIEFGIPMKLIKLINVYLNVTYSRDWVGKQLSDMFPTSNGSKQDAFHHHCFSTFLYSMPLGGFM
jgi:hypothetical protein